MSNPKEDKKGIKKLNNIPEMQRGQKRKVEDCIKFQLNITEFRVLDDTVLSKKYPIYFGKTPHIAIPRIQSNVDDSHNTDALLNLDCQDHTPKENESNQVLNNTVLKHISADTFKENTQTQKTNISTNDNASNLEVTKSKYTGSEKYISEADNQTIVSNNIVTELDVTKLKLTFKNLINHRSSATSGDDKSSREQSGSKLPMIRGTSIEDVRNNTDAISQKQSEKDLHFDSDPDNVYKENDNVLHTLDNITGSTCTVVKDSCRQQQDDVNVQAYETKNASSHVTSKAVDIEKQTRVAAENNSELPVLADISTSDFSVSSREDPFPPILTPANATDTSSGSSEEGIIATDELNQSRNDMLNDGREQDCNSRHEVKSPNTDESTNLKVYVVEESSALSKSITSDEHLSLKTHRKEQSVEICKHIEENGSTNNPENQTLVENQEQTKEINTEEEETNTQNANSVESVKDGGALKNDSNALIKRPKPKVREKPVVKREPLEIIRKPLSQHDGYDSDATMIYDEDERNDSRCLLVRGTDMTPLKIKHTQQLLRLKSKIVQSTDEHESEKSPETMECIESLYPSFRGENLDKSEDVSNKVCSSEDPERRLCMKDSEATIAMENTPLEAKGDNPSEDKTKPINKIRICMKKNKSSISKHRHHKREKNKSSEIQLPATKWDQAITGPDNMILTDLTISRGIAKNSSNSKTNSKSESNRDRNSEKKRRNENKKRRDSQDMVLKNINKIFPKPRRKRPKDEDDLPTILPPKRRRQGKGHVTPDPKSDMDRIKHEFPHFNWLEKKYTDQGNVDDVVADINNHLNEISEQNVTSQNDGIGTTEDPNALCHNNEIKTTQANQPTFEKRIINSSEVNLEGNTPTIPDDEPPLNLMATDGPDKCIHTEEDEHMTENEPVLVIDEAENNANGSPLHSSTEDAITTTASHIVCSSPTSQASSNYLTDAFVKNTSKRYDTSDARSQSDNSQYVINEKDSSFINTDEAAVPEKQSQTGNEVTLRYPVQQSRNDSDGHLVTFGSVPLGTNSTSPNTEPVPNSISNFNTTSLSTSISTFPISVSASVISVVANTISSPVSSMYASGTGMSNINSFQKHGSGVISSAIDTTACILSAGNTVSSEVPLALSLAHEPVTKKLKMDENASRKNNEIPPLIPLHPSSKQGKPIINRAKLFDPEIEGTYNEIKQLKRELEIKNQEVGRMMLSLKEKEEKLRSLLLSSPLGKTKHQASHTEMNLANSSAVTTSECAKQSTVLTSSCKSTTPLTNEGKHIDLNKTPPPAHVCKKENTKEILRTLAANPVNVPLDIKATCPSISRQRPLSPPSRLRKDGYGGPLQAAHAQKPFEIPGTLKPMTSERSKSDGGENHAIADVYTTRALSAPVQDHHLGSPINLHHTSRPDSIGAINSAINNPKRNQHNVKLSSSMHVPFSTQSNISIRQQSVNHIIEPINQSTLSQKTIPHAKQSAETAIQQELTEALKRRQNFEQKQEQQDYQQFKISKPQSMTNDSQRQIFQNTSVDSVDTEYQKKTKFMHGMPSGIPITTFGSRPSVHTLSKSGQPPPYSGELVNALQRTTQQTEMVNGRMNTTSMVNLSHTQLPHSVRLIGAATVPMNNNSRINESNRVLSNTVSQQQQIQIPTSHSGIRPQSVPRQQLVSIPSSVSQQVYHQKAHKEGIKVYQSQFPLHINQTLQSNQQMVVPVLQHRMTSPQTINQSQVPPPRMHQLVQAHPGQQMNGRQQEVCNLALLETKMKGMISGRSVQRHGNVLTQQDGNAKAHHIFGSCIMCGKFSLYLCSTCQNIWYCSQQCQLKHWTTHQHDCKYTVK